MGDRVTVQLTVLRSQLKETLEILDESPDPYNVCTNRDLSTIEFAEVNYGQLHGLELLIHAGIAYESEWEGGYDFGPGTDVARFTPEGDLIQKEIYTSEFSISVDDLKKILEDHEALKQVITQADEKCSYPSFDNQEEYGKIYQTKKLICP